MKVYVSVFVGICVVLYVRQCQGLHFYHLHLVPRLNDHKATSTFVLDDIGTDMMNFRVRVIYDHLN